jgi:peptide/nickel transport system substrate-binding protein
MRWCDARVDRLEDEALAQTDQSQRKRLYREIAEIVAQQVPIVYLFNADYIYAYRTRLRGFHPNAFLPTWNTYDWHLK